ncbi:CoA transferase [Agromyces flavus]
MPQLADDAQYATMGARNRHRDALRDLLTDRLRTRGADEWFELLRAAGVPSGPILGVDGGVRFAESLGLDPVAPAGRGARVIPTVRHPIGYASGEVDYSQAPPHFDGDRERVLAWLDR